MALNYLSYTLKIHSLLMDMDRLLGHYSKLDHVQEWIGQINSMIDKLENMHFRAAVVGEFKRGKSSFINALLRKEILPADVAPATATINRITYGDIPESYIYWKDGRPAEKIAIEDLSEYVTKITEGSARTAQEIREAVVKYPCRFCENNVDLIDTPGMNDDDEMTDITISQLSDIDLAIVLIDPKFPVSKTEAYFIAQLIKSDQIYQIVFVVSKIDTIRPADRERLLNLVRERIRDGVREELLKLVPSDDPVMEKYRRLLSEPVLFPVSSTQALSACEMGDQQEFEDSGFDRLQSELLPIIIRTQHKAAAMTPINAILRIAEGFRTLLTGHTEAVRDISKIKNEFAQTAYSVRIDWNSILESGAQLLVQHEKRWSSGITSLLVKCMYDNSAYVSRVKYFYQRLSKELPAEEQQIFHTLWIEHIYPGYRELKYRLLTLLKPFGSSVDEIVDMLDGFDTEPEHQTEPIEFGWVQSMALPYNMNRNEMMNYVDKAVGVSFDKYYQKRYAKIVQYIRNIKQNREQFTESVVQLFFRLANSDKIKWEDTMPDKETADRICSELDRIVISCSDIRDSYNEQSE